MLLTFLAAATVLGMASTGPMISREELFAGLDYTLPGLAQVKKDVDSGDYDSASRDLLEYARSRKNVKLLGGSWYNPGGKADTAKADDILKGIPHGMLVDWYPPYQFKHGIEWDAEPFNDREWHWGLNRHDQWVILGRAYKATGDEKYARRFVEELTDWVTTRPPVEDNPSVSVSWRPIEAGIRMSEAWPEVYQLFLNSPSFTPEAHLLFLRSVVDHARFLERHPTAINHLLMELNGRLHASVLLPEFKESAGWRQRALDGLRTQLDVQLYPDGMQYELTPCYHQVSLLNFLAPLKLCNLNAIPLPDGYEERVNRMCEAMMWLVKPSGYLPAFNDSDAGIESIDFHSPWADARPVLRDLAERTGRKDVLYAATAGEQGKRPGQDSHTFPYAGYYVMRSGWDRDSLYLAFDAGPFGAAHQHEDKLSFEAYAFGETLISDTGRFTYADPVFRPHVLSTAAHNSCEVDGRGQARACQKPEDRRWVVTEPLDNPWISGKDFDYAEGVYDDGYGPALDRSVTHKRRVLFVRNEYWLVVDDLTGSGAHTVDTYFHFAPGKVDLDAQTKTCRSANTVRPNLLITPSRTDMACSVITGSTSPPLGWIAPEYNTKYPAPVAKYTLKADLPARIAYVLYPTRPGRSVEVRLEELPVTVGGATPESASAYAVHVGGRTDYLLLAHGVKGIKRFAGSETSAEVAVLPSR